MASASRPGALSIVSGDKVGLGMVTLVFKTAAKAAGRKPAAAGVPERRSLAHADCAPFSSSWRRGASWCGCTSR